MNTSFIDFPNQTKQPIRRRLKLTDIGAMRWSIKSFFLVTNIMYGRSDIGWHDVEACHLSPLNCVLLAAKSS